MKISRCVERPLQLVPHIQDCSSTVEPGKLLLRKTPQKARPSEPGTSFRGGVSENPKGQCLNGIPKDPSIWHPESHLAF